MCSSLGLVESHCEGAKTRTLTQQKQSVCQGFLLLISDGAQEVAKPPLMHLRNWKFRGIFKKNVKITKLLKVYRAMKL